MYSYTVHIPSSSSISPKTILANKPHQAAKIFSSDFLESSNIQKIQKIHVTNVKGKTLIYSLAQENKKILKVDKDDNKDNKDDDKDDKDDKSVNKTNNQVAKRMLKFAMNSATAHNKNLEKKKVKK